MRFGGAFLLIAAALGVAFAAAGAAGEEVVSGSLAQSLTTGQPRYDIGEKVRLTYAIQNRGDRPITYTFPSTQRYDMWVEAGGAEVYRLSKGKFYAAVVTSIVLKPGETKTFNIQWDQRDDRRRPVGAGIYRARVRLTPMKSGPPEVAARFEIGSVGTAPLPLTVREAVRRAAELADRRVIIAGLYRGWEPDPDDPNCRPGPPVTRSDWVIADHTGGMYVTGRTELSPSRDVGTRIEAVGKLARTPPDRSTLCLRARRL